MFAIFLLLVGLINSFNYSTPIIIDTGIYNQSFIVLYDSNLKLIFVAFNNTVITYDLDGQLVKRVTLNVTINKMVVTFKPSLLITTKLINDLYEYDLNGRYLSTISICGYNYKNRLFLNQKNNNYYLLHDLGWIYNLYSFSAQNKLINRTFISSPDPIDNTFNIGEFTGNMLVGSWYNFSIYDSQINKVAQIKLPWSDNFYINGGFEIDETTVCIFYDEFYIYSYDGRLVNKFEYKNTNPYTLLNIRFNKKYKILTFIDTEYINQKNVPYIKFGDLNGQIIYKLEFENNNPFVFYNYYSILDEETDILITNFNSIIKIWKPV